MFTYKIFRNFSFFICKCILLTDVFSAGLDIETCHIIEMACLITDENLNIIAEVNCGTEKCFSCVFSIIFHLNIIYCS